MFDVIFEAKNVLNRLKIRNYLAHADEKREKQFGDDREIVKTKRKAKSMKDVWIFVRYRW